MESIISKDQQEAVNKMFNGCILCGGVGSGKSRTALAYYYKQCGGLLVNGMPTSKMTKPKDLLIITTARKRDSSEWEAEIALFHLLSYNIRIVVDSWNNIQKYTLKGCKTREDAFRGAFVIFDEQKVVSGGTWAKSFINLSRENDWILLSATPGDKWEDYISVFIANGYFRTKTEFYNKHCIFSRFTDYPKIEKYYNEGPLIKIRNHLLIDIDVKRHTTEHDIDMITSYNKNLYSVVAKDRWNPWKLEPIQNGSEWCYSLRKVVNSDLSRVDAIMEILEQHPRAIIFYSYDYELDILRQLFEGSYPYAEWNGHKHQPVPTGDKWVYLVEYVAGAEAWNCITTDTIIFYSQQYSYKTLVQSCGRINRRNTPYVDLYHYHLKSRAPIDQAISLALKKKKKFNERKYIGDKFENTKEN